MRGRHDVPAHPDEIHSAAEQRNEHRREKIAEPPLLPEQRPVNLVCNSGGHRAYQFTISRRSTEPPRRGTIPRRYSFFFGLGYDYGDSAPASCYVFLLATAYNARRPHAITLWWRTLRWQPFHLLCLLP